MTGRGPGRSANAAALVLVLLCGAAAALGGPRPSSAGRGRPVLPYSPATATATATATAAAAAAAGPSFPLFLAGWAGGEEEADVPRGGRGGYLGRITRQGSAIIGDTGSGSGRGEGAAPGGQRGRGGTLLRRLRGGGLLALAAWAAARGLPFLPGGGGVSGGGRGTIPPPPANAASPSAVVVTVPYWDLFAPRRRGPATGRAGAQDRTAGGGAGAVARGGARGRDGRQKEAEAKAKAKAKAKAGARARAETRKKARTRVRTGAVAAAARTSRRGGTGTATPTPNAAGRIRTRIGSLGRADLAARARPAGAVLGIVAGVGLGVEVVGAVGRTPSGGEGEGGPPPEEEERQKQEGRAGTGAGTALEGPPPGPNPREQARAKQVRAIIDAATERERLARADRQRCHPYSPAAGGGTQDAKSQASATGSATARNVDYTRVTGLSTSEGGRDRIESLIASTAAMERRAEAHRAELDRVRQGEQERSAAEDAERLRETISHYVQAGEVERRTNGAECEMSEIHRLRAELGREQARAYVLESQLGERKEVEEALRSELESLSTVAAGRKRGGGRGRKMP